MMTTTATFFVTTVVLLTIFIVTFTHAKNLINIRVEGSTKTSTSSTDSGYFQSAVIDSTNSAAYFAGGNSLCKFNLEKNNFSFVSCVEASLSQNPSSSSSSKSSLSFRTGVIDTHQENSSFAYFVSPRMPSENITVGHACKFNVTAGEFSFVACIPTPNEALYFLSSVISTKLSAAFFATALADPNPLICKLDLKTFSFGSWTTSGFRPSCISPPSGVGPFGSAAVSGSSEKNETIGYFATTSSGSPKNESHVCKVDLVSFKIISCIKAPSGINHLGTFVIDEKNNFGYVGGRDQKSGKYQVCKIDLGSNNNNNKFAFASSPSCIPSPINGGRFGQATIDPAHSVALFPIETKVCTLDLSKFAFTSCISVIAQKHKQDKKNNVHFSRLWASVFDTKSSAAYVADWNAPARVYKIATVPQATNTKSSDEPSTKQNIAIIVTSLVFVGAFAAVLLANRRRRSSPYGPEGSFSPLATRDTDHTSIINNNDESENNNKEGTAPNPNDAAPVDDAQLRAAAVVSTSAVEYEDDEE